MPQKIVAGNWKMNLDINEGLVLTEEISADGLPTDVSVMIFPPALYIDRLCQAVGAKLKVGVQNFYSENAGAYTGELGIPQIKSVGSSIGLIGHSERRALLGESHEVLKAKVDAAVANDFDFIFCCGEPLDVRESGDEARYVKQQLDDSLFHLEKAQITGAIIAYEPVWAIGTGKTATSEQAECMHKEIRGLLAQRYDTETAQSVSILYGGSCKPENAKELFACANVDGGLIGGASLNSKDFRAIINAL